MTNFEKHKEDLTHYGIGMCANINGKVAECGPGKCKKCDFGNAEECDIERTKWLYEEAVEKPIDWSKVPIDTKVLIARRGGAKAKRYFAGVDVNGVPCYYSCGATSWSSSERLALYEKYESISLAEEL